MSHFKGIIAVAVFAGLMAFGWFKYEDFLAQGRDAPEGTKILNKMDEEGVADFEMADLEGKPLKLSEFQNSIVILNFWASWCEPCIAEFPSLLKLIDHYKGKIILLAISADYEREDLDSFLKAFKAESPYLKVAWDQDQKLAKSYGTFKLPESYIIGPNLKLIRKVAGVDDWYNPNALEYFDDMLKKNGIVEEP